MGTSQPKVPFFEQSGSFPGQIEGDLNQHAGEIFAEKHSYFKIKKNLFGKFCLDVVFSCLAHIVLGFYLLFRFFVFCTVVYIMGIVLFKLFPIPDWASNEYLGLDIKKYLMFGSGAIGIAFSLLVKRDIFKNEGAFAKLLFREVEK